MKSSFSCRSSIFGLIFLLIGVSGINISGAATVKYTVPGAPTMIGATGGLESAVVRWKAPAKNGGKPITSYKVTYYPGAKTQTCKGSRTSCTVMIPNPNKPSSTPKPISFRFIVMAVNAIGVGPASVSSKSTFVKFRPRTTIASGIPTPSSSLSLAKALKNYGAVPIGKYTVKSLSSVQGVAQKWVTLQSGVPLTSGELDPYVYEWLVPEQTIKQTCMMTGSSCSIKYVPWNGSYFGWEETILSPVMGTRPSIKDFAYMYFYKDK